MTRDDETHYPTCFGEQRWEGAELEGPSRGPRKRVTVQSTSAKGHSTSWCHSPNGPLLTPNLPRKGVEGWTPKHILSLSCSFLLH